MVKSYFKKPKLTQAEKDKMNAEVRVRDRVCQVCGVWCLVGGDIHHRRTRGALGDEAWETSNMILLCREHHTKVGNGEIPCPKIK